MNRETWAELLGLDDMQDFNEQMRVRMLIANFMRETLNEHAAIDEQRVVTVH